MCLLALLRLLIALALLAPACGAARRAPCLLGFGTRLQCIFLSVALSVFVAEVLKGMRRPRPAVRRRRGQCLSLFAFRRNAGLCQLSVGPCDHGVALAFAVAALWPQAARGDGRLCGRHLLPAGWCCWRIIRATWSAARWSAWIGAMVGALLVCGPAAGVRHPPGRQRLSPLPGPSVRPSQKGCPRDRGPIISGRRRAGCDRFPRACPSNHRAPICHAPDSWPRRRLHRRARAQRAGQCRAADRGDRRGARRPLGL